MDWVNQDEAISQCLGHGKHPVEIGNNITIIIFLKSIF